MIVIVALFGKLQTVKHLQKEHESTFLIFLITLREPDLENISISYMSNLRDVL